MKFNNKLAAAVSGAILLMAGQVALADSTTDIVDALVSKGVLTEEEGKLITKGHESKKKADGTVAFKNGFKINSGDGKSNFSVNGRVQADYRYFDTDDSKTATGSATSAETASGFDIRRAYLGVKGNFLGFVNYEATGDFAGSNTLKYYWVEPVLSEAFKVRFGLFKMPGSLEQLTSSRFIDFTERDFVASMAPAVNKGIMIHGVPTTGMTYALSVSNGGLLADAGSGTTRETSNSADGKTLNGRLTLNFAELAGNKEAIGHVGGWFGWDENLPSMTSNALTFRTNGRGTQFFATEAASGTSIMYTNPEIKRGGLEGIGAFGPIKVQGEYAMMNFQQQGGWNDKEITAGYIGVSYMLTGENYASAYKNGLMDRMSPKNNYTGLGSSGWGAWEIGARYSKFDASDFTIGADAAADLVSGASTQKVDSYTVGIKWIPEPNTRFLVDYIYTDFNAAITGTTTGSTPSNAGLTFNRAYTSESSINMRAQFDF
jgi:phosphate-selective porin OprO/OprP